jgi:hypothetical protein
MADFIYWFFDTDSAMLWMANETPIDNVCIRNLYVKQSRVR